MKGLRETRWPGRLERIDGPDGPYLLDGAHNPDGAAALAQYLQPAPKGSHGLVPGAFLGEAEVAIVFGALADKAWPGDARPPRPGHGAPRVRRADTAERADPILLACWQSGTPGRPRGAWRRR